MHDIAMDVFMVLAPLFIAEIQKSCSLYNNKVTKLPVCKRKQGNTFQRKYVLTKTKQLQTLYSAMTHFCQLDVNWPIAALFTMYSVTSAFNF